MATDLCVRRLTKEIKAIKKDPMKDPKITVVPNESNILEMHYVLEGSKETPYEGGVYHGKLLFPKEYPLKPPGVMMCTPSGRFQPNRRLCLSMSDFHPESWNPMWSVSTILTGLYSFMVESNPTLGSVETSLRKKRQLAAESLAYNVKNDKTFCKLFPEYVERYEEEQKQGGKATALVQSGVSMQSQARAALRQDGADNLPMAATLAWVVAILSILMAYQFIF